MTQFTWGLEMPKPKGVGMLPGQLSFIEGEPPIAYCKRCGRRLKDKSAIECGFGATCLLKADQPFDGYQVVLNRLRYEARKAGFEID